MRRQRRSFGAVSTLLAIVAAASLFPDVAAGQHFPTVRLSARTWSRVGPGRRTVRMPDLAVADRVLVGFRASATRKDLDAAAASVGGRVRQVLARAELAVVDLPPNSDLFVAADRLKRLALVTLAEPDRVVWAYATPNDTLYPNQAPYMNVIRAPQGWDHVTGSPEVVIACPDTGVQLNHPDIVGKTWVNTDEIPANGLDDDSNGFVDDVNGWDFDNNNNDPNPNPDGTGLDDLVSHGTRTAGVAAAVTNNSAGIAGVDWAAKIMAVQVLDNEGYGSVSVVIAGIQYAANNGADVINLSLGGSFTSAYTTPIRNAVAAGAVLLAAAGNDAKEFTSNQNTWDSPVCNDGNVGENDVIGVGSTDNADQRAWFSNYDSSGHNFVDVMAPGENIWGPLYYDGGAYNTPYGPDDGTSFSTPLTAGLAALIKAAKPAATPAQITTIIRNGADNIDALNPGYEGKLGAGRINIEKALNVADPAPHAATNVRAADTPYDAGNSIDVTWTKSSDDGAGDNDVTHYEILVSGSASGPFASAGTVPAGTQSFPHTGVPNGSDRYYLVRTWDAMQYTDAAVAGPAQAADNRAVAVVNLPAGVSMVSFHLRPVNRNANDLFGVTPPPSLPWARYDPQLGDYHRLNDNPSDPYLLVDMGLGFWVQLGSATVLTFNGYLPPAGDFTTHLPLGWSQRGNVYPSAYDFTQSVVTYRGNPMTVLEADAANVLSQYAWYWDSATSQHVLLHPSLPGAETHVPPEHGFWVFAFRECDLTLPRSAALAAGAEPRAKAASVSGGQWTLQLVASASSLADRSNFVGLAGGDLQPQTIISPPPPPGPHVDLYLLDPKTPDARAAGSIRAQSAQGLSWDLAVECSVPNAEVTVSVPDLSRLPRGYYAILEDLDAGARRFLRTAPTYRYNTGPTAATRRFRLTVSAQAQGLLTITSVTASPTRGGGTEFSFALSQAASVDCDIVNIAGRRLSRLRQQQPLPAGTNHILWDGRTDLGTLAPAGTYLLNLRASDEARQRATAVRRFFLQR